uniref:Venom pyridine 5' phosphate oxidase n=1 Tax=Lethocerus distinctifemur TaxID=280095 RepID=A0A2K8JL71_9HEMI|nr:venom pyridine 5' phosphate oxidase [Lethocerus distinctifemur]
MGAPVAFAFSLLAVAFIGADCGRLGLSGITEIWKIKRGTVGIPPKEQAARMARYVVHNSDWCSVSHVSRQNQTYGYPQARVFSMVDGPTYNSTGVPYIYVTLMDEGTQDLLKTGRCSMTMSLAQGDYCKNQSYDPEDPRCPQVILTGNCLKVPDQTEEWNFARNSLFCRHPIMARWPPGHQWIVMKLQVKNILLVDDIGGNKYPTVEEYFKAPPELKSDVEERADYSVVDIEVNAV